MPPRLLEQTREARMPAMRSIAQIDHDLRAQYQLRAGLRQQITSFGIRLDALRRDYAGTGPAIEQLLDERLLTTDGCPDTPAELHNPGDPA